MIDKDKWFRFERRWAGLERQRKDLEFAKAEFCRDLRAEFPKGDEGDKQFQAGCVAQLGVTAFGAQEMLAIAVAAVVVKDERTWKELGGFRAVRHVVDLPRKEQVSVLEAAKVQARAPINIMRERGLVHRPEPKPAPRPVPNLFPVKVQPPKADAHLDAVALAQYIARTSKDIPRDILAIVNRYRFFMQKAA